MLHGTKILGVQNKNPRELGGRTEVENEWSTLCAAFLNCIIDQLLVIIQLFQLCNFISAKFYAGGLVFVYYMF